MGNSTGKRRSSTSFCIFSRATTVSRISRIALLRSRPQLAASWSTCATVSSPTLLETTARALPAIELAVDVAMPSDIRLDPLRSNRAIARPFDSATVQSEDDAKCTRSPHFVPHDLAEEKSSTVSKLPRPETTERVIDASQSPDRYTRLICV